MTHYGSNDSDSDLTWSRIGGVCERCELLTFDPELLVAEGRYSKRRRSHQYGFIPLAYVLEDQFPLLPNLKGGVENECKMCPFIRRIIWAHIASRPELLRAGTCAMLRDKDGVEGPGLEVSLRFDEYHPDRSTLRINDRSLPKPGSLVGQISIGEFDRRVILAAADSSVGRNRFHNSYDILSKHSVHIIRGWLGSCMKGILPHQQCPRSQQSIAPNRLLHIVDDKTIRLQHTAGMNIRYAILSYCWGDSPAVVKAQTVTSNLPDRLAGFSVADLPHTIRDSVVLARHLGISHLWVDALCIVQDSGEWADESQWMMQYYENAYLTIAPIACHSADESFLAHRPWFVSHSIRWPGDTAQDLQFTFPFYRGMEEEFATAPWFSRGWTFQERLLSARVLFIGKADVMLQCRADRITMDDQVPARLDPALVDFMPLSQTEALKLPEWNDYETVRQKWYSFVGHYAGRQFTRESDRLVALAGISSKFSDMLLRLSEEWRAPHAYRYLDGFWEFDLWHGLAWKMPATETAASRSRLFPSWSWCSTNKALVWNEGSGSTADAELLQVIKNPEYSIDAKLPEILGLVIKTWAFAVPLLETTLPPGHKIELCFDDGTDLAKSTQHHGELIGLVLTSYLGTGDDAWLVNPSARPHNVCGMMIAATGDTDGNTVIYKRVGAFDVFVDVDIAIESDSSEDEADEFVFEFDEFPVRAHEFESSSGGWLFKQIYARRGTYTLY